MQKQELVKKLNELVLMLEEKPDSFTLRVDIGKICAELKEYSEAIEFYEKALIINPKEVGLNLSIGLAYSKKGDFDSAISCYEKILNHEDNSKDFRKIKAGAYLNIANIHYGQNNFDKAIELLKKSIELNSDYIDAYLNLANCYNAKNDNEKAINSLNAALKIDNENPDARYNLGATQLLLGDFKNGFKNYEYRIFRKNNTSIEKPPFEKPCWNGENLNGKTLFVYDEQGIGDVIQFLRFFPELKQKASTVLYNAPTKLAELFKDNELICPELVAPNIYKTDKNFESRFDYYIPLMSLANLLNITPGNIPFSSGYISSNSYKIEKFKEFFAEDKNLKIGIKWRGNLNVNPNRIIDLKEFFVLKDIADISLYSFQKDVEKEEIVSIPDDLQIIDLGRFLDDFSDTAGALAHIDILITNDSSMAHLGGATGVKTFVLLPYIPDWRWGLNTDKSPWYKSVKLFRQRTINNWSEVFSDVKKELLLNT